MRDKDRSRDTKTNNGIDGRVSGALAGMAYEIHIDRKIYKPVFWPDRSDVA